MTKRVFTGGATALALIFSASMAPADVTAEQVWADFKAYLESFGYAVSASESMSGDTLDVSDLSMSMAIPDEGGTIDMTLDGMTFTSNGDGTVSIALPESMPFRFNVQPEGEDPVTGTVTYSHSGFEMTVSGDEAQQTYDYTAQSLSMRLTDLTVEGETMGEDQVKAVVTLNDIAGNSVMFGTDVRDITQSMTAASLSYEIDVQPPDEDGRLRTNGGMDGLKFEGTSSIPASMDMQDMAAAVEAGFAFDGTFTHDGGNSSFDFTEEDMTTAGSTTSEDGSFTVAVSGERVQYRLAGHGQQMELSGGDIPFPVSLSMAESLFNLVIPVGPNEEPEDYALALTLGDFSVSEMIWGMVDPGGVLPHDPATISFDITGTAKMLFSIFDPEQMETMGQSGQMPAELNTLSLNDLLVQAAGAKLAGMGAFTFDNTDLQTFEGFPRPEGKVDLTLDGANQLIDRLVQMGIIPEEQAMGTRMMMGMFAVPGEGDDSLKSTIEVTPEGQVLANGQRLR